jgi:hypothetical protein
MNETTLQQAFSKQTRTESLSDQAFQKTRASLRNALQEARNTSPFWQAFQSFSTDVGETIQQFNEYLLGNSGDVGAEEIKLSPLAYAKAHIIKGVGLIRRGAIEYRIAQGSIAAAHPGDELIADKDTQLNVVPFKDQEVLIESGAQTQLLTSTRANGNTLFNLRVKMGRTIATINKTLGEHDLFALATPTAVARAHGTEFITEVISETQTFFAVTEGEIGVKMGDQEVALPAGQSLKAVEGEALVPQPIPNYAPGEIYMTQLGDTFADLEVKFGANGYRLRKLNPHITNPNAIPVGTLLLLPKAQNLSFQ